MPFRSYFLALILKQLIKARKEQGRFFRASWGKASLGHSNL